MDDTPKTPALLEVAREAAGITYAEIGAALGKDASAVWRWFDGEGRVPLAVALPLLDVLRLTEPDHAAARAALVRSITRDHGVGDDLAAALRGDA